MAERSARVVVGVDGSVASLDAIRWAARYAVLIGAEVEAVTSWFVPSNIGISYALENIDWQAQAEEACKSALSLALGEPPEPAVRIRCRIVQGHPARALISAAHDAELLVVGSRGHGGFTGMMLGSVSEHVVAHAPCPVVVVRHPQDPPND